MGELLRMKKRNPVGRLDVVELWNDDGELEGYALMDRETITLHECIFSTRGAAAIFAGEDLFKQD